MRRCPLPSLVLLFPFLLSCGGDGAPTETESDPVLTTITVTPDTVTLLSLGATTELEATARDQDGNVMTGVSFTWSSSDGSVAAVDGDGTVTAVANGAVTIRAGSSGRSGSAELAVRAGELDWAWISAGVINSCGSTTHGTAFCWGDNVHGQTGDGTTSVQRASPVEVVGGILYFDRLSIGGGHVCALTSRGRAYCWGNTFFGEGGYGEEKGVQEIPVAVSGGHRFTDLAASGNHTCGVTTDGTAYCWGRNGEGQLGDGTTTNRSTPVETGGGLSFEQISGGPASVENHTCAVAVDGVAYCWGSNADGELGDGTTTNRTEPVAVAGGLTFNQVAAGGRHSCGLTADGIAYCWGSNSTGQLGDATMESRMEPVAVSGGLTFQQITAGNSHTCGLTTDGIGYCWGANVQGQLGDGTNEVHPAPVEVSGGLQFRQLDAGEAHTCGTTTAGEGYCWGDNQSAEVGDGTNTQRSQPTRLPDPDEIG